MSTYYQTYLGKDNIPSCGATSSGLHRWQVEPNKWTCLACRSSWYPSDSNEKRFDFLGTKI